MPCFQLFENLAERGGFEPPIQLLTVQRFSKLSPSRPVAWIQTLTDGLGAVSRRKSPCSGSFMHPKMHLEVHYAPKSSDIS